MLTIRQLYRYTLAAMFIPALLLAFSVYKIGLATEGIIEADHLRYEAYKLANELHQSSDDLTRLART